MVDPKKLKAAMVLKGITQQQLAQELGITHKTFIEQRDSGTFRLDKVKRMIEILNIEDPVAVFLAD